jgi:nanoRNase/pAp phosphatase (c-di-AMP/oligoRNAs hydrolase)
MQQTTIQRRTRSDELIDVLSDYRDVLIVAHDNPDPDAIATGWGVATLIEEKLGIRPRLVGGGGIVRAENRHMLELLQPPIELVDEIHPDREIAAVLVDCGLGTTNHLVTRAGVHPVAVIDHHLTGSTRELPFRDVRPEMAASATIAASYLREQGIEPAEKLATAMLYAIQTETRGSETHYSRLDRIIVLWLTERADPSILAEIENAPLARSYFGDLSLALQSTFLYDEAAFCLLPRASCPEIVGEVADLLIRCRDIKTVFCGAAIDCDLLISARTDRDYQKNAALLLQAALEGLGGGGGHQHRAGGKIAGACRNGRIPDGLEDELRDRWLAACGVDRQRGTRLVARREIVENL